MDLGSLRKTSAFLVSLAGAWLILGSAARAVTFEIDDPVQFAQIIDTNQPLVTNVTITGSAGNPVEAPVWIPSGNFLVFSDCVSNKLQKLVLPNTVSDYYDPPANTLCNGNMLDAQERLINCEAGSAGLQVVMITNGVATALVNRSGGKKFYSPNDVVVKSDGTIWFTDPGYNGGNFLGESGFVVGYYVYRFNPTNGNATVMPVVTSGVTRPNGLCFSPDESLFYLADSDTGPANHHILVYNVTTNNSLTNPRVFATITNGFPDGIRCDVNGRIWSSGGDGVYIYAPDGHLIGAIKYGLVSNLCFGGTNYHTLFMDGYPLVTSMNVLTTGQPSVKKLSSTNSNGQLNISWPAPSSGFALQESDQAGVGANWTNSILTPSVTNAQNVVNVPATNAAKFYRLFLN